MTDTGTALFAAVVRSVDVDGNTDDQAAVDAFVDWIGEQEAGKWAWACCDCYLHLTSTGQGTVTAELHGKWHTDRWSSSWGQGQFGKWLCKSIGFDYYLDGKWRP